MKIYSACKELLYKTPFTLQQTMFSRPILNVVQMYCRMLQGKHSAILLTFIKLPFVIKIFVLSIFEWPFYTSFTEGAQWLSGRVLDSRQKGCGFEPLQRHCIVVFEQDTFILA